MANKKNYSKMSTKNAAETKEQSIEAVVEESVTEEMTVEEPEVIIGCVANCALLNIRKEPKADAAIIGTLKKGEIVSIINETREFYGIDRDGCTGYCMKKYITINH